MTAVFIILIVIWKAIEDTHTGKIYVDAEHKLETVGDYGKENNIKANFLGLTKE